MSKQSCDLTFVKVEGEVLDCLNVLTPAPQSRCVPLREGGRRDGKEGRKKGEEKIGGRKVKKLKDQGGSGLPW